MNKLVYRVRNKETQEFMKLGRNYKSSWLTYPSAAIKYSKPVKENKQNYEVVVFELVETQVIPLR